MFKIPHNERLEETLVCLGIKYSGFYAHCSTRAEVWTEENYEVIKDFWQALNDVRSLLQDGIEFRFGSAAVSQLFCAPNIVNVPASPPDLNTSGVVGVFDNEPRDVPM
jgi:hypothetical protein